MMLLKKAFVVYLLHAGLCFAAEPVPKPGTYYTHGQLGIRKTEVQGANIKLTFKPVDEQFYWCPGAKVQVTNKATVVTFVRCKTSEDWNIDVKAKIGNRLVRSITLDTHNKNTYVRNGPKKFKLIYAAPKKKGSKASAPGKKQPASTSGSKTISTSLIRNEFAIPFN